MTKRIVVDPPTSDARRDRVERQLFNQLATVRVTDRADAAVPPPRRNRGWMVFAFATAAVTAVAIGVVSKSSEPAIEHNSAPSRVVTPLGGTSTFTVGDVVIVAGSDTSVDVKHGDDGGTTLIVGRGSVDCDVTPRNGRPPFHVIAGDVSVEVVGTRFTVTRTPAPRVDVARGKVRVTAPGGTWLVAAGESWTPQVTATQPMKTAEVDAEINRAIEIDTPSPVPAPAPAPAPAIAPAPISSHVAYQGAERLESTDPAKAAKAYRAIANGKDTWARLALLSLAELNATKLNDPTTALHECDEFLKRFPNELNVEEIMSMRIDILRVQGQRDEARAAAADYLRQFPKGTYAGTAARIASPQP